MAYKIIRDYMNKYQPGREIVAILDGPNDLDALGADYAPGSLAIVASSDITYIMNASGEWVG